MPKNPDVDAWLAAYDNPMKPVVMAMRERIIRAFPELNEAIKWSAPTFVYKGNIAGFVPKSSRYANLYFHDGAAVADDYPTLEGDAKAGRSFKVANLRDLETKEAELLNIFRTLMAMKNG